MVGHLSQTHAHAQMGHLGRKQFFKSEAHFISSHILFSRYKRILTRSLAIQYIHEIRIIMVAISIAFILLGLVFVGLSSQE